MAGQQIQTVPDAFKLEEFGGMFPAWDDTLIPPNQAASSLNSYLYSGALTGWRKPKPIHTLANSAAKFVYRLPTLSEAIATATIYLLSLPTAGDVITLGEENYTFRATVTPTSPAYDVLIGADVTAAVTNLFAAFTLDNGQNTNAGVLYGIGCTANPDINQESPTTNILALDIPRIQVFSPSSGATHNLTQVGVSAPSRAEWRYNNVATTTFQGGANVTFDASITGPSTWMEFLDPDTDVIRSPVVNDSFDRYYFASPSLPPQYNTRARIQAGSPAWLLGVPAPGCSPGVTVAGGGDDVTVGFDETTSTGTGTMIANSMYFIPITTTAAISLDSISITPASAAVGRMAAVLYEDVNGVPKNLINVGVVVEANFTVDEPVASAFLNPTGLLPNVQYWIGVMTDVSVDVYVKNGALNVGVTAPNTFDNGPPPVLNTIAPNAAPLQVFGTGTSDALQEARSYVYTYLTEYDEESAPSPATVETGWSNGTWTVLLFTPPVDQMGVTRNIKEVRLYRSVTSLAGASTYFHVVDLPIGTESYADDIGDDEVVTRFQLQSQLWTPPPEDLLGFINMPNGMIAGFRKNELWFCEPYRPHAWPASYVLTTQYPIIGLGVSGNSVVACTSGAPYVATGTAPGSMSATSVPVSEPCHSRGSILGTNDGVYYTSPNGLIMVTPYGAITNTSEMWVTRERWQELTPQKNLRSVFLVSSYFSLGCIRNGDASVAQRGFTIELNSKDSQSFSIWPQPGGHRLGFNKLAGPNGVNVDNLLIDPWSSTCLVVQNGAVYYYDFADQAPVLQTYVWRSKKFMQKSRKNFAAMRVSFSTPAGTPTRNATRLENATDNAVWTSLPADRYGFIRVYADNVLVTVREIFISDEKLRILSGFKAFEWQWEIEARVPISEVQIGTSIKAMANI